MRRFLKRILGQRSSESSLSPAPDVRVDLTLFLELQSNFKSHALRALVERRVLEKELARLKSPNLYEPDLDIVADIGRTGSHLHGNGWVSVVITNFNYGVHLPRALESVGGQDYADIEVVVVDDASTDGSPALIGQLCAAIMRRPTQAILLKHNVGLPTARNIGIKAARGEFVFTLDADNHLLPHCVRQHVAGAEDQKADAAYGVVGTFGATTEPLSKSPFDAGALAKGPYIDAMALFRRSAIVEAGLYSTEPVLFGWEDYELWLRFAAEGRRVAFVPTILSHYYAHRGSMIGLASMDTEAAWLYLFGRYPDLFGLHSVAERAIEAKKRARRAAVTALEHRPDEQTDDSRCGCKAFSRTED